MCIRDSTKNQVGYQAASLLFLIWGAPLTTMAERRHCSVGRREGPSMAQRGYLGIHAEVPTAQYLRSAIVVNGAPQIKSHARRPYSRPGLE